MRKIRVAQIGLNEYSHATFVFKSMKKQAELFDIAGVVLPEKERERYPAIARVFDGVPALTLDEVLADPAIEAVVVETDEVYLTQYALLAARAGKHIHMEKPGGTDPAAFARLIAAVKEGGKVFHVGYMYRYNPLVQELLAMVNSGALGEILSVEAQMNCFHPTEVRQWLDAFPGGMMFFLGCHLVDLILQIQGTPERVIPFNQSSGLGGVTADDFGMALFAYPRGVSFAKTTAVELGGFVRRQLVVNGTKGTYEIHPMERTLPDGRLEAERVIRTSTDWNAPGERAICDPFDRYDGMMAAFAAMVRGEKENPCTPDYEWTLYRTLMRACGKEA